MCPISLVSALKFHEHNVIQWWQGDLVHYCYNMFVGDRCWLNWRDVVAPEKFCYYRYSSNWTVEYISTISTKGVSSMLIVLIFIFSPDKYIMWFLIILLCVLFLSIIFEITVQCGLNDVICCEIRLGFVLKKNALRYDLEICDYRLCF